VVGIKTSDECFLFCFPVHRFLNRKIEFLKQFKIQRNYIKKKVASARLNVSFLRRSDEGIN